MLLSAFCVLYHRLKGCVTDHVLNPAGIGRCSFFINTEPHNEFGKQDVLAIDLFCQRPSVFRKSNEASLIGQNQFIVPQFTERTADSRLGIPHMFSNRNNTHCRAFLLSSPVTHCRFLLPKLSHDLQIFP